MKSLLNNEGANIIKDSVTLLGTEDSTSTSTGALICQGGLGVAKNVFVGGNVSTSNLKLTSPSPNIEVGGSSRLTFGMLSTNFGSYAPLLVQNTLDVGSSPVAASISTSGGINIGKSLNVAGTTESTSTTTGTIICSGGVGVAKNIYVGGAIQANRLGITDNIAIGALGDRNTSIDLLIHSPLNPGSSRLQFTDEATGTTTDSGFLIMKNTSGNALITNLVTGGSMYIGVKNFDAFEINSSGVVNCPVTTDSTSTSNGAVTIKGGMGITKRLNVGSTMSSTSLAVGTITPSTICEISRTTFDSATVGTLCLTSDIPFGFPANVASFDYGCSLFFRGRYKSDNTAIVPFARVLGSKEAGANYTDSFLSFATNRDGDRSNGGSSTLTERMRISSEGNVGIGTTTPTAKLHVIGGLNFGRNTVNQLTSNATAVTINSSSGKIVTFGPLGALDDFRIFVSNNVVSVASVILVSIGQQANFFVDAGIRPEVYVNDIQNGYFTIQLVNAANVAGTNKLVIHFLVC